MKETVRAFRKLLLCTLTLPVPPCQLPICAVLIPTAFFSKARPLSQYLVELILPSVTIDTEITMVARKLNCNCTRSKDLQFGILTCQCPDFKVTVTAWESLLAGCGNLTL